MEIYPMPMFVQLTVTDLDAASSWYQHVLAFDEVMAMPGMVHLRYRKYADVMLVPEDGDSEDDTDGTPTDAAPLGRGLSLYFNVEDETVADVAERAEAREATITCGPVETAWNTCEVAITDPDGYELVFSEPVDTDREFDEVAEGM
ncbi:VOC family protein [Halorussus halophilus]|uniref:VOC family protein n=1 Tax=Halorussus halophilus TaxID=2650975 RepID=UPI00130182EA|nr:VOC family protein [Halorussus halophilus]